MLELPPTKRNHSHRLAVDMMLELLTHSTRQESYYTVFILFVTPWEIDYNNEFRICAPRALLMREVIAIIQHNCLELHALPLFEILQFDICSTEICPESIECTVCILDLFYIL